jgi:putative transposase
VIPISARYVLVDKTYKDLSVSKQCNLLSLNRSSFYVVKRPKVESELNLEILVLMDTKYTERSDYGSRRMHKWLCLDMGYTINIKRVDRLYYEVLGLTSLLPGPHTSVARKEHKKYPYLLRNVSITHSNQVWVTDITYLPMNKGFMYLLAIMDVYSRKILSWSISNTMDSKWCYELLEDTIALYGRPEIFNTDQGSQFTSDDFVYRVLNNGIKLSMDVKGRALDNIYIERFWRTIKYEHVYLYPTSKTDELSTGIDKFVTYYNEERIHSSIGNSKPSLVYESDLLKSEVAA